MCHNDKLGMLSSTLGLIWTDSGPEREKANSVPGVKVMILREDEELPPQK